MRPGDFAELDTDAFTELPVYRKQVAKLLLEVHQGALHPRIPPVDLVQPRNLQTGLDLTITPGLIWALNCVLLYIIETSKFFIKQPI